MDDAVEFRNDGERTMRGRLRRQELAGALEDESREDDSPHEVDCNGVRP
jgi:hypothetical protein